MSILKIEAGQTFHLLFPFGDFKEGTGQWPDYQYTVATPLKGNDGTATFDSATQQSLYAKSGLHKFLQGDGGMGAGAGFTIGRQGSGTDTRWSVKCWQQGTPVAPPVAAEADPFGGADPFATPTPQAPAPPVAQATPAPSGGEAFAAQQYLYNQCFEAAAAFWAARADQAPQPPTTEDFRSVATTLFIECNRKGIVLRSEADEEAERHAAADAEPDEFADAPNAQYVDSTPPPGLNLDNSDLPF
jgi:hypothetical protein